MKEINNALRFTSNANLGKNSWWRFALSIFLVLALYLLGVVLSGFIGIYLNNGVKPESFFEFFESYPNVFIRQFGIYLEFICGMIGLFLAVKFIHKRKFWSLVTVSSKINISNVFEGTIVYFIIYLAVVVIYSYYNNNSFQYVLQLEKFVPLVLISIIFTLIQISFEEFFHRGYMLQTLTHYFKYPWIALLISSGIFGLVHLSSPEYFTLYCIVGLFLGLITIVSNSLELAIGIHLIHNLFSFIVNDNLEGTSLFYHKDNPSNILIWVLPIILAFFYTLKKYGVGNLRLLFAKTIK
jgi:membrane protease YdiL (CAAX protease family)